MSSNAKADTGVDDSEDVQVARELLTILWSRRQDLIAFLRLHGRKETLVHLLTRIESAGGNIKKLFLNTRQVHHLAFHELPTDELCSALLILFQFLNVSVVHEVGAGTGLVAARLEDRIKSVTDAAAATNPVTIHASDNFSWNTPADGKTVRLDEDHIETYRPVEKCAFRDVKCGKDACIMVVWLPSTAEKSFYTDLVVAHAPKYVIHIGESDGGSCYTEEFSHKMTVDSGYIVHSIHAKQISQIDYFQRDRLRKATDSRTTITLWSRADNPPLTTEQLIKVCSGRDSAASNLGTYSPLTTAYVMQDLSVSVGTAECVLQ